MAVFIYIALSMFYFQQCRSSFESSSTIMKRLTIAELRLDVINDEIRHFRTDFIGLIESFKDFNRSCCTQQASNTVLPTEEVNRAAYKEFKRRILSALQAEKQAMFTFQKDIIQKLEDLETQTDDSIKEINVSRINARISSAEKMAADIERQVNSTKVSSAEEISDLKLQLYDLNAKFESLQNKVNERTGCPPQWYLFLDSCYYLSPDERDWFSAQDWCRMKVGYLVEYNSMAEVNFVQGMAKTLSTWGNSDWAGFWVGADDNDEEGIWKTSNSSTKLSDWLQYWLPGQPDAISVDEDCMISLVNINGRWNDDPCSRHRKFVCEKKN